MELMYNHLQPSAGGKAIVFQAVVLGTCAAVGVTRLRPTSPFRPQSRTHSCTKEAAASSLFVVVVVGLVFFDLHFG